MLAKHALSQLSYSPGALRAQNSEAGTQKPEKSFSDFRFLSSGFRARFAGAGGPGRTRTSDLTLIRRAL